MDPTGVAGLMAALATGVGAGDSNRVKNSQHIYTETYDNANTAKYF